MIRRTAVLASITGLALSVSLPGCSPTAGVSPNAPAGVSSKAPAGKVAVVMNAVNYSQASLHTQSLQATNTNNAQVGSILSTAPEKMVVYLQSISGLKAGQPDTPFWTSTATGGVSIALQNGNVDMSTLGLGSLTVPADQYDGVVLKFARVAQIKGSVKGTFAMDVAAGSGPFAGSPAPGAAITYTNEAVSQGETKTFSTRADLSQLNAETFSATLIGHNADFDPAMDNHASDSELTDIDLAAGNDQNLTIAQIRQDSVEVESKGSFSVAENATSTLTLAVDLNRMLRFYANTRPDHQPPNPGMKAGTSYFFTTVFPSSISVFGGAIGSVQGYQLSANSVDAWMTVFLDDAGNVLSASVMPDDDNALTIMKGKGSAFTGALSSGMGMTLGISNSSLSGFKQLALNEAATGTLTIDQTSGNGIPAGTHYDLHFQRLL